MRYTVVLTPDDGQIAVRVPAMPGIFTWDSTTERALNAAVEAIRLKLEEYVERGQLPPADRAPGAKLKPGAEIAHIEIEFGANSDDAAGTGHQVA